MIGNGASRAVWDRFKYPSLYETAKSTELDHPLLSEDQHIFEELDTTNFEQVLDALATSEMVCDALGLDATLIRERYASIQRALFEAVSMVHPYWRDEDTHKYRAIRSALLNYDFVFSVNYDLVVYWSIMTEEGSGFKDYFFAEEFDLADTEIWPGQVTKVLYLHGGVHLAKARSGATIKRRANMDMNLLASLETMSYEELVPLFITEGRSRDKLNSIHRSDYLSFAYQQFAQHSGPLIIFGNSLDEVSDQHLVNAMYRWGDRRIGVSVYPAAPQDIIAYKAGLHKRLPEAELFFFDSTTHPLGSTTLRISEQE